MVKNKDLAIREDADWNTLVSALIDEMDTQDMPDKVITATELLLCGYPTTKVAKEIGVTSQTVRNWLSSYPIMSDIIARGKPLLAQWRMSKLEQQFFKAINRSEDILGVSLSGIDTKTGEKVDAKILTVVAAQARYIIGLFAGQQSNVNVRHELDDSLLLAHTDALDYITLQMKKHREANEPIDAIVRVIDAKVDNTAPMLDENGDALYGKLGEIDKTEDGILCHVCGKRLRGFSAHISTAHTMTADDYELIFALPTNLLSKAEDYWKNKND